MSNRLLAVGFVAIFMWSAAAATTPPHARVPFAPGLPDFPPLRKAVQEPRTATLPVAGNGTLHVVTGQGPEGSAVWWLLHKKPDGTALSPLTMKEEADGTLTATQKLALDPNSNGTTALELSVPRARDVLLYRWTAGDPATVALGKPLENFALLTRDGRTLRLAGLKGPIVVLNSWATWCVPCVEEIPALNRVVKKYARRGVAFVAVLEPKASEDLGAFLKKHPFAYRHMIATDSSRRVLGDAYPRHVILDADGNVAYATTGGSDDVDRTLSAVLDRLLAK